MQNLGFIVRDVSTGDVSWHRMHVLVPASGEKGVP